MPDVLALEWDPQYLRGLDAQISASAVHIRQAFEVESAVLLKVETLHRLGGENVPGATQLPVEGTLPEFQRQFKEFLNKYNIRGQQAIVTLPRETVVLRRLELPDAPDDELPQMVRFQASTKSSLSLEELALDYIPFARRDGSPTRDVLLAMVPQATISAIREFVTGVGLELIAVRMSPIGSTELAIRSHPQTSDDLKAATLLLARHGDRVEISLLHRGQLSFAHGARLNDVNAEQATAVILTEISRGMMSAQNQNLGVKVTQAILLGTEADFPGLAPLLQQRLNAPVSVIDPFSLVTVSGDVKLAEQRSAFAGVVGNLWSQVQPNVESVNFLAPRKPAPKVDKTLELRKKLGIGAAIAVAVVFLACWLHLRSLSETIDGHLDEINQIANNLKAGQKVLNDAKAIQEWVDTDRPVLDELMAFRSQLPKTERIYLSEWNYHAPQGKSKARISARGQAREQQDVIELQQKLVRPDGAYEFQPREIKKGDKEHYPVVVDVDANLKVFKPGTTTTKPVAVANPPNPVPENPKAVGDQNPVTVKPAATNDKKKSTDSKSTAR